MSSGPSLASPGHRKSGLGPVDGVVDSTVQHRDTRPQRHEPDQRPHPPDFLDQQVIRFVSLLELPIARPTPGTQLGLVKGIPVGLEHAAARLTGNRRERADQPNFDRAKIGAP